MEYVLTLNDQDMVALNAAIGELPFKVAAPLVQKINGQISAAAAAKKEADAAAAALMPSPEVAAA